MNRSQPQRPPSLVARAHAFARTNDFDLRWALARSPKLGCVDVTDLPFSSLDELSFCVGMGLRMLYGAPPSGSQISDVVHRLGERATYFEVLDHLRGLALNLDDLGARARATSLGNFLLYFSLMHQGNAYELTAGRTTESTTSRRRARRRSRI